MKYLVLSFENAGFFKNHAGTRDKIYDIDGSRERSPNDNFLEPITVNQISNVLHVLFGERPVPINRYTFYDKVDYLVDKANNSFLKIESYLNDKGFYQRELIHLKKADWNTTKKELFLNWKVVNNFLEDELYSEFVDMINEVFSTNPKESTLNEVIPLIKNSNDQRVLDIFDKFRAQKKNGLYDVIFKGQTKSFNSNFRTLQNNLNGIDFVTKISGKILVPVSEEDIDRIRSNKGCATILDGGLVSIKGIIDSNFLNTSGFRKVSDISTQKFES